MPLKQHIIVTGTGRSGTTFLMQLFTALGLDTGYTDPWQDRFTNCDAGMEWTRYDISVPTILKAPGLCTRLDALLQANEIAVEQVIVPVRDLFSAAESRRRVSHNSPWTLTSEVPGGLVGTRDPAAQEGVLALMLYSLIEAAAKHQLKLQLLHFPRLTNDPQYLYGALASVLGTIAYPQFLEAFAAVSRPALVHRFEHRWADTEAVLKSA